MHALLSWYVLVCQVVVTALLSTKVPLKPLCSFSSTFAAMILAGSLAVDTRGSVISVMSARGCGASR